MGCFDFEKYIKCIEDFVYDMKNNDTYLGEEMANRLKPLCELLRVSLVTTRFYESQKDVLENNFKYDELKVNDKNPQYDECCYVAQDETTTAGYEVHYKAYKSLDDEPWTEQEKDAVKFVLNLMFVFSGRIRLIAKCEELTFYDVETKLPNSAYFRMECQKKINMGSAKEYCVLFYNIRGFARLNATFGRNMCLKVMTLYAQGLKSVMAESGFVCRLGGDNFACLVRNDKLDSVKSYLAGTLVEVDDEVVDKVTMSASVGIYEMHEDIRDASEALENASKACNIAKNVLKEPYVYYNEDVMEHLSENRIYEDLFPDAIENEEFKVYYQPKVNLKDYKLCGAEALCRWVHDGEILMPYKFIPLFEQSNLICELDFYMLEHVCKDLRSWLDSGRQIVTVSVNLSRKHFGAPDLLTKIIEIIDSYNVPHEYIEIELTETTTDVDYDYLKSIVYGLKSVGIRTSVDDFGVGYSSLNLIRDLPWDVIKLDKSFLYMCDDDSRGNTMLKHVIALTQSLGMECIVEGVESIKHVKLLKENNCFNAQGFYFDKPIQKSEFEDRLSYL